MEQPETIFSRLMMSLPDSAANELPLIGFVLGALLILIFSTLLWRSARRNSRSELSDEKESGADDTGTSSAGGLERSAHLRKRLIALSATVFMTGAALIAYLQFGTEYFGDKSGTRRNSACVRSLQELSATEQSRDPEELAFFAQYCGPETLGLALNASLVEGVPVGILIDNYESLIRDLDGVGKSATELRAALYFQLGKQQSFINAHEAMKTFQTAQKLSPKNVEYFYYALASANGVRDTETCEQLISGFRSERESRSVYSKLIRAFQEMGCGRTTSDMEDSDAKAWLKNLFDASDELPIDDRVSNRLSAASGLSILYDDDQLWDRLSIEIGDCSELRSIGNRVICYNASAHVAIGNDEFAKADVQIDSALSELERISAYGALAGVEYGYVNELVVKRNKFRIENFGQPGGSAGEQIIGTSTAEGRLRRALRNAKLSENKYLQIDILDTIEFVQSSFALNSTTAARTALELLQVAESADSESLLTYHTQRNAWAIRELDPAFAHRLLGRLYEIARTVDGWEKIDPFMIEGNLNQLVKLERQLNGDVSGSSLETDVQQFLDLKQSEAAGYEKTSLLTARSLLRPRASIDTETASVRLAEAKTIDANLELATEFRLRGQFGFEQVALAQAVVIADAANSPSRKIELRLKLMELYNRVDLFFRLNPDDFEETFSLKAVDIEQSKIWSQADSLIDSAVGLDDLAKARFKGRLVETRLQGFDPERLDHASRPEQAWLQQFLVWEEYLRAELANLCKDYGCESEPFLISQSRYLLAKTEPRARSGYALLLQERLRPAIAFAGAIVEHFPDHPVYDPDIVAIRGAVGAIPTPYGSSPSYAPPPSEMDNYRMVWNAVGSLSLLRGKIEENPNISSQTIAQYANFARHTNDGILISSAKNVIAQFVDVIEGKNENVAVSVNQPWFDLIYYYHAMFLASDCDSGWNSVVGSYAKSPLASEEWTRKIREHAAQLEPGASEQEKCGEITSQATPLKIIQYDPIKFYLAEDIEY